MAENIVYKAVRLFAKCIFKIKINGAENFPAEGGCMVCSNHISMWDPVLLSCFMPRKISFIAKEELKKVPFVGSVLKACNTVFIKRNSGDLAAIKESIKWINTGSILGIFPTGTREKVNPGAKPKSGAALIATKAATTVVPVGINATYKLFSTVEINIGKPLDYTSFKGQRTNSEQLDGIAEEIYGKIIEIKSC